MNDVKQQTMRAAAIDHFGGPITMHTLPVPEVGPGEILIRVECAGVGVWDPMEREGGFAEALGHEAEFPYVLGTDAAGVVVAVGDRVDRFEEGDRVYAMSLASPKGGSYAQYMAVDAEHAAPIPAGLSFEEAGVMMADGVTALRGLDDTLGIDEGESILIFGASGGVGHMAVQLAKRMGARVMAVASGEDGVALALRIGADEAIDGHSDDVIEAALAFAPDGLDAVLLTAGGNEAQRVIDATLREGGRVAYPHGVQPEPKANDDVKVIGYDGTPDADTLDVLNALIESGPFEAHVARVFPLDQAEEAQVALGEHYLGKLALRPGEIGEV